MKNRLCIFYSWLVRTIMYFIPDIPFTMRLRGFLYSLVMQKCGKNLQITNNAILKGLQNFNFGSNIFIGNNTVIMGSGDLFLDDEVMIAPGTVIVTGNHTSFNNSFRFGEIKKGIIIIKKGAWVGANCSLAIGSVLPENSVLGANSFLNKSFEKKNALYAGVPAKFIKEV